MENVSNRTVATDQDKLPCRPRSTEGLKQVEHALDADIDCQTGRFLDRSHVQHMGHALHRSMDGVRIRQGTAHDLDIGMINDAVVAKRAQGPAGKFFVGQKFRQEIASYLAR